MKRLFTFLLVCSSFSLLPKTTLAWGMTGHRIVGQIADSYLTTKARAGVKSVLGYESLAMVANWPDFVRSDTNYNYLTTWHYVNLRPNLSLDSFNLFFQQDTTINAYTKTNFIISELKSNKLLSTDQKAMYLKILVHLVGDLHQPMHLGRPDDRGGNAVKVNWFREASNLHKIWDEALIDHQQLSFTEYVQFINIPSPQQLEAIRKRTMLEHIWDTYQLTQRIYNETIPESRLGYEYNYKFLAPMNDALLKGGIHLSVIVNDIFA